MKRSQSRLLILARLQKEEDGDSDMDRESNGTRRGDGGQDKGPGEG